MVDYFKVLGLNSSASDEEIKTAYRKLSKKFHPDMNDGDKFFEERFKEIQTAYEKLNDPNYRTAFRDFQNKGAYQKSEYQANNKKAEHNPPPKPPPSTTAPKTKKPFISSGAIITFLVLAALGIFRAVMKDEIQKNGLRDYRESLKNDKDISQNKIQNVTSFKDTSTINSTTNETDYPRKIDTSIYEGTIIMLNENYMGHPSGEPMPAVCILFEKVIKNDCEYNFEYNDSIWFVEDFKSNPEIFRVGNRVVFSPNWEGGNYVGYFELNFINLPPVRDVGEALPELYVPNYR